MNRLLVRIQIYESMLRDSLWSPEREAERRSREAEQRNSCRSGCRIFDSVNYDATGSCRTKKLDAESRIC